MAKRARKSSGRMASNGFPLSRRVELKHSALPLVRIFGQLVDRESQQELTVLQISTGVMPD
jgi:hypothetical protein